jgi:hypothetical protein
VGAFGVGSREGEFEGCPEGRWVEGTSVGLIEGVVVEGELEGLELGFDVGIISKEIISYYGEMLCGSKTGSQIW